MVTSLASYGYYPRITGHRAPCPAGPLQTAKAGRVNSKNVAVMHRGRAVFGCYGTSFYKYRRAPKHARATLDPKDCYRYFS